MWRGCTRHRSRQIEGDHPVEPRLRGREIAEGHVGGREVVQHARIVRPRVRGACQAAMGFGVPAAVGVGLGDLPREHRVAGC